MSARQKIEKVIPLCKHCMKRIAWDNGAKSWLHDDKGFRYCSAMAISMAEPLRLVKDHGNASS